MEAEEENGGADVPEENEDGASSVERSSVATEPAVTNDAKEAADGVTEGNGEDGEPVPSAVTEKEDGGPVVEMIDPEKGAEIDNGQVKTTDDKEETARVAVVEEVQKDGSTEAETGSGSQAIPESQQPELEIAAAETENRGQSEVEDVKESAAEVIVEVEDVKEPEPVIVSGSVETAVVEESGNSELVESAAEVEEVQSRQQPEDPVKVEGVHKDDRLEAEAKSGSDMKVEVQDPEIVAVENEDRGESELLVKIEDLNESETEIRLNVNQVKESECVILLESVEPVVEETGNVVLESTAEVEVESRQQPEDPVAENYKVEVEVKELETGFRLEDSDVKESESVIVPVVEETCNAQDYKVEVEDAKELETRFRLEDLDVKESESVIVPESVEHLAEETCNAEDYKVEVEDIKEMVTGVRLEDSDVMESESVIVPESVEPVVEGTCNAELEVSAAEIDVESRQQPEDPVSEDDKVEIEERKEPESMLEEAVAEDTNIKEFVIEEENREDPASLIEKADNITSNPEPESVVSEADRVEVEQKEEAESSGEALKTATAVEPPDAVVLESTASECFPIENEVAEIPNVEPDAPTDEQSVKLETKANYVCDDIDNVSTEKVDRSNNGECIECPKELLKEVARSIDDKHLELGSVNDGTTDQSEPRTSNSDQLNEPISWGTVPRDAELKTTDLQPTTDSELETEVSVQLVATDKGAADHVGSMELKSDNGSDSIEGGECKASSTEENRSTNKDDVEEPSHGQAAAAETIQAPSEAHVVKRHPVYLIKVGRFIDDELEKKIQQAGFELQEKTRIRDSVQEDIRKKLVTLRQYDQELEDASAKENAQRAIFNEKQEELDGVQVLVNRINNATSIADIDEKIQNMVHRQQHDTIDLKQEKHYIREINKLKRLREQLSLKKAPQEEIDEALAQRAEVYTRLEKLKKELKPLRDVLKSATNRSYELRKRSLAERDLVKRLRDQYFVANRIRQEAYMQLQELRKQSAEKFKHFSMYKADQNIAANFRFSGDNEGLQTHCSRQIERIMDLWNNNDDFRKDYIKSNVNSTLRRLGTLDGRSLGPGEEAPIVSPYMDRKPKSLSVPSSNVETSALLVATGGKQDASAPLVASEGKQEKSEALAAKQVTRTNHLVKSTVKAKSTTKEDVPKIFISPEPQKDEKETKLDELAKKEEELEMKEEKQRKEMTAKEEELRKEKAAAEMKEKLILEQKIKAKEAEERKRRKSEKARAKADYRARKEAELKEKKKAKKEMKRVYGTEARNGDIDGQTALAIDTASSETSVTQEAETTVKLTPKRRSSRPAAAVKQYDRVQPLPLPLRNRGKRKMTTWMWVILTVLLVLLLFFAGNYVTVSSFSIPDLRF